jgi:tetratricopeptide (TPR) repeat protein
MQKVVHDIRAEGARRHQPMLNFVASNVPNLDDEYNILSDAFARFRSKLDCSSLRVLHHYDSLDLIQQTIFTAGRPKARLSVEYRELIDDIIQCNDQDRDGVLAYLQRMAASTHALKPRDAGVKERLDRIAVGHANDAEVLLAAARVCGTLGLLDEGVVILTSIVELGSRSAEVFRRRAVMLKQLGRNPEAENDVANALAGENVGYIELMLAIQVMNGDKLRLRDRVDDALSRGVLDRLKPAEKYLLARQLSKDTFLVPLATRFSEALLEDDAYSAQAQSLYTLCLIHLQDYAKAMEFIDQRSSRNDSHNDIANQFNYAMAHWGATGHPSTELFLPIARRVAADSETRGDANAHQCFAIVYWAVGRNEDALKELAEVRRQLVRRPLQPFSAWSYLYVSRSRFEEEIGEIQSMIEGAKVQPAFMMRGERHNLKGSVLPRRSGPTPRAASRIDRFEP